MKITDNLANDISNAPDWFLKAINEIGIENTIEDNKGKISYSEWSAKSNTENLRDTIVKALNNEIKLLNKISFEFK